MTQKRNGDGVRPHVRWPEVSLGSALVGGAVSLVIAEVPAVISGFGISVALFVAAAIVARLLGIDLMSWFGFASRGGPEDGGGGQFARCERGEDVGGGAP